VRSRFVLYGLLVGCAALATMIYRHLFADEPIRFEDLRRLIVLIPLGALLLWFRTDWLKQVRRESQRNKGKP
jgi:hypothetical protein